MKNIKTRIAAAAFAAVTTVCGMQAISASAWQQFYYTTNKQEECDESYFMGQALKRWARDNGIYSGAYWNQNVASGVVCKEGYKSTTYSNTYEGTNLTDSAAFARYLAHSYFGTKTYMEICVIGSTDFKIGDQVRIGQGSAARTIFITNVNGNQITAFSLDNSHHITYDTYTRTSAWYLKQGNTSIYVDYLTRPIKEGDVNGDGVFTTADLDWLKKKIGDQPYYYPKSLDQLGMSGSNYRLDIFARAVWANDWKIEYSAYYTIGYNLNNPTPNNTGHMRGNYGFVKMYQNG